MSSSAIALRARPAARRTPTKSRVAGPAPLRTPSSKRRPRLHVVDTAARARTRRVRLVAWLVGALVVVALLAAVAFHVQLAQGPLELDPLARQTAAAPAPDQQPRLPHAQQSPPAPPAYRAPRL